MSQPTEFYFNVRTGQVEEGRQSVSGDLMGPYSSHEEAQGALENARRRNEAADEAERRWEEDEA